MLFPKSHQNTFRGENRLWLEGPAERSNGTITVSESTIDYTWSFRGEPHKGTLTFVGPQAALRADWVDGFHAAKGMVLHGFSRDGLVELFATYSAGDVHWGWRIELDTRDPEAFTMRMYNVELSNVVAPAVTLHGLRPQV